MSRYNNSREDRKYMDGWVNISPSITAFNPLTTLDNTPRKPFTTANRVQPLRVVANQREEGMQSGVRKVLPKKNLWGVPTSWTRLNFMRTVYLEQRSVYFVLKF